MAKMVSSGEVGKVASGRGSLMNLRVYETAVCKSTGASTTRSESWDKSGADLMEISIDAADIVPTFHKVSGNDALVRDKERGVVGTDSFTPFAS
jgi:hypothetical protein